MRESHTILNLSFQRKGLTLPYIIIGKIARFFGSSSSNCFKTLQSRGFLCAILDNEEHILDTVFRKSHPKPPKSLVTWPFLILGVHGFCFRSINSEIETFTQSASLLPGWVMGRVRRCLEVFGPPGGFLYSPTSPDFFFFSFFFIQSSPLDSRNFQRESYLSCHRLLLPFHTAFQLDGPP